MRSMLALACLMVATPAIALDHQNPKAPEAENDSGKVICKREIETGSLVARRKRCLTRAQWDAVAVAERRGAEEMVNGLRTRPDGAMEVDDAPNGPMTSPY